MVEGLPLDWVHILGMLDDEWKAGPTNEGSVPAVGPDGAITLLDVSVMG